jgi:monoamine oxidase
MNRFRRATLAAMLSAPFLHKAQANGLTDVDVAIVGAGAAGLSAAKALQAAGLTSVILEARHRVGGRAFTNTAALGRPFDMGGHWLHLSHINPMIEIAKAQGLLLTQSTTDSFGAFANGTQMPRTDDLALDEALGRLERRAILPSIFGADRPMALLANMEDPAERLALAAMTISMGTEPDEISLHDIAQLGAGADMTVDIGFGALVATQAAGADIRLGARVSDIYWQEAAGVTLEGSFGRMTARAAIVTVPTAVLAAGAIRFSPVLPHELTEAIGNLPLGAFEKIGFRVEGLPSDLPEYSFVPRLLSDRMTHALHVGGDRGLATVLVVADAARELLAKGQRAMAAFGREVLTEVAGSDIRILAEVTTNWLEDDLAQGAYAHARVGHAGARATYTTPLAERLWFAGEAAPGLQGTTIGGAWESGRKAAGEIAARL